MIDPDKQSFLTGLFDAAVEAADARAAIAAHLPARPKGRTIVVGAGKGAAQLAAAFEDLWEAPCEGVVVTRYGYGCETKSIRVMEAAHPVPDAAGMAATQAMFDMVSGLGPEDMVVALVCGGGSALLPCPPAGLGLADEQALNEALLASGAPIGVMNAIRKHASGIKGGRLAAAAHPAKVVSLIVSDVPGDDPAQVASGPTVPDAVTLADARAMIAARDLALPTQVHAALQAAPAPDDPVFAQNEVHVIASARLSLEAAAQAAEAAGVPAVILSDAIEGEADVIGQMHAAIARDVITQGRPFEAPIVILSGGETTVTLRHKDGRGGRNTAFLLGFAQAIEGVKGISALAADTDGIDGSEDNAGAFADGNTVAHMRAGGVDPADALRRNDAWGAFDAAGAIFRPGPTGTNVNDFRAILIH
ncbi:MAG: glycerate kinase [Sulfitobacter sp.]